MRYTLPIVFFLMVFRQIGNAQNEDSESPPDTIFPGSAVVHVYATLDSVPGDTIYEIESPRGYVIRSVDYSEPIKIALWTKKGYIVFNATEDGGGWGNYSCSAIDFDGKGHDELLISWREGNGRSGWRDGWSESSGGQMLWDLDKMQLLFSIQDHYEYHYWITGAEFDSLGNLVEDSLGNVIFSGSGGDQEFYCTNYNVEIEFRKITVQQSADCPEINEETGEVIAVDTKPTIYKWTKKGLVEQK